MLRQLRHDVWATERLIAHCRALTAEQLELTSPGTYGSIRGTLAHIISADEGYLVRLHGEKLHEPPFWQAQLDTATLDDLATHLGHVKDAVERLFAAGEPDGDRLIADTPTRPPDRPQVEMNAWVPLTQFVHHGSDHRAQINAILTANGLEPLDVQVWPWAMELGATQQVKT